MSGGLAMLARALRPAERTTIERAFRRMLADGRPCALPATAFVSIYERGRVVGCVGHADVRTALAAARTDPRFGGARGPLEEATVQLSFLVRGAATTPAKAESAIELGTHGLVAFDASDAIASVLLPDAAADTQRDAAGMLRALAEKAGLPDAAAIARVMLVTRERVLVRPTRSRAPRATPIAASARWLAARVDEEGAVAHGIDARSGRVHRTGPFHLGRAAVVVEALAAHGGHGRVVRRARAWLGAAIAAALADDGEGLPRGAAERAGSLALAVRAGVDVAGALELAARANAAEIASVPWHAAQVATALGLATPAPVREAALAPIDRGEWAPWSALAARVLGDPRREKKACTRLAASVPARGPHVGGVRTRSFPEVALSALVAEVLAGSAAHRSAARRALAFVDTQSFLDVREVHAALDPALALGASPLAPHADFLRADVTAHALLARLAMRR